MQPHWNRISILKIEFLHLSVLSQAIFMLRLDIAHLRGYRIHLILALNSIRFNCLIAN